MSPETKEFTPIEKAEEAPRGHPVFRVGDRFFLSGVEFSIRKITKKDLVVRPVK